MPARVIWHLSMVWGQGRKGGKAPPTPKSLSWAHLPHSRVHRTYSTGRPLDYSVHSASSLPVAPPSASTPSQDSSTHNIASTSRALTRLGTTSLFCLASPPTPRRPEVTCAQTHSSPDHHKLFLSTLHPAPLPNSHPTDFTIYLTVYH